MEKKVEKNFKKNNDTTFVLSNEFVGFTHVPNFIFQDENMSLKGIGLYCVLLQFQNLQGYTIYLKTIQKMYKDGKDSLRSAMNELEKNGYIQKLIKRNDKGHFVGVSYVVHMKPIEVEEVKTTECGKSAFGESELGKPAVNHKLSLVNKELKKEEEDKANEVRPLPQSENTLKTKEKDTQTLDTSLKVQIDLSGIFAKLRDEYKDLLQPRSINAVLKNVELTYNKTVGTNKHIHDLEAYAMKCLANKISELEARRQEREQEPKQVKQTEKKPIRTEEVPYWFEEEKKKQAEKKAQQVKEDDFDVDVAREALEKEISEEKEEGTKKQSLYDWMDE